MSYIDLHMHTFYSDDGEFSPKDIVEFCLNKGLKYFAIADHNSTKGVEEGMAYSEGKGIEIIPGIELDCTIEGTNLHVLGYGIDYKSEDFLKLEEGIIAQEQEASKRRMEKVRALGIHFSQEVIDKLSRNGVVNGEMIAEAAMEFDKERKNPLLAPYFQGGNRSDNPFVNFYWDYCSQGKPAYEKINYISLSEAIDIINRNGGIPILAHPGNNVKEDRKILDKIIESGVKGMEVYSSYHSKEQEEFYKEYALNKGLIVTCGSDFHGKTKPSISIGSTECDSREEEIISNLKNKRI